MQALEGYVRGLNHVAIVVAEIAEARKPYEALGLTAGELEYVEDQKVNVLVMSAGSQRIELVEPAAEDSPVTNFLAKRGGGLHHLCFRSDDIEADVERLKAKGYQFLADAPSPGAHGSKVIFIHPRSCDGVLIEINQPAEEH